MITALTSVLFPVSTKDAAAFGTIAPPLTDRELFQKINLDYPGLEKVSESFQKMDIPAAKHQLADYYRNRSGKHFWFEAQQPGKGDDDWQKLVDSTRTLVEKTDGYGVQLWENGIFDWNKANLRNKERMYFFGSIGKAYAASGNERIAKAWADIMRSFVCVCPRSEGGSMWASMHVGIRMRSGWPEAFHCFIKSPSFTDEDVILFLKSVYEQTDYILQNHSRTSNWLTFEMAGLYVSGAMYPEFSDAEQWRRFACETAIDDMQRGWLPDGMSIELTPGYGQFFSNYYVIYDLAKQLGRLEEFNLPELVARTEKPYELYLKIMTPDRSTPATNDNAPQNVVTIMNKALTRFPQRQDFLWVATEGKQGRKPEFESVLLPYAGFAAMRSGWERDANMLYFDFGPVGYRHAHQDKLEVILWAYGRQVLFDPGRVNYSDTRHSNYCMDTFSHNTVLVDDRPQRRIWYRHPHPDKMPYEEVDNYRWVSDAVSDYASGQYNESYGLPGESDAYPYKKGGNFKEGWGKPATHHRRICFYKPDVFLVADTLVANDDLTHHYDVRWHLDSTEVKLGENGLTAVTADPNEPNLEVAPLLTDGLTARTTSAQDEPEVLGWKVVQTPEPATTLQHLKSDSGVVHFLTLLLPLKPGQTGLLKDAVPVDDHTVKVSLSDGRTFVLFAPTDPTERLTVNPASSTQGSVPYGLRNCVGCSEN